MSTEDEIDAILSTENFLKPTYSGKVYGADEKGLPDGLTPPAK